MLLLAESQVEYPWREFFSAFGSMWLVVLIILAALTVIAVFRFVARVLTERKLSRSGMADIDKFGGETFEMYLEVLFRRLGYKVERTKFVGDYGGDLVLSRDGVRTAVQAKRYARKSVGIDAVQEALGAKAYYDCSAAMVITNSRYTQAAKTLARKGDVVLWDRGDLTGALDRMGGRAGFAQAHEAQMAAGAASDAAPPAGASAEPSPAALADVASCVTCAKVLTAGERQYCEQNASRFSGQMLCFRHQRVRSRT